MPSISIQHCLSDFENGVFSALELLIEADSYRIEQANGRYYKLGSRRREIFAAIALLRMHLAWENYIEDTFVRYMCGSTTTTGYSPTLITPQCRNTKEAVRKILGGSSYLIWSPKNIEVRARQYFDNGEPFVSAIGGARNTLDEINTIRNRFAHRSGYSALRFESVVQTLLGVLPRGINPGRLLLMQDPAYPTIRLIDRYSNILLVSARNIVP
jgi:hypothetical protein